MKNEKTFLIGTLIPSEIRLFNFDSEETFAAGICKSKAHLHQVMVSFAMEQEELNVTTIALIEKVERHLVNHLSKFY